MSRLAVPELLDAFEIRHAADFGRLEPARKHAFLKRLYKTLAAAVEPTRRELHLASGVELYFAARIRPDGTAADLPGDEALKAAVLLAERTLVTFAFHEVPDDVEVTGEAAGGRRAPGEPATLAFGSDGENDERRHRVAAEEFSAFLALLCRARPAMEAGAVHVLPLFPADRQRELRFRHETVAAHLNDGASPGDDGDAGSVPALRLPSLAGVTPERVLTLREEAGPVYALRTALAATLEGEADGTLAQRLQLLDEAVEALGERLHEPAAGEPGGLVLALPPQGPDAALAAGALRDALRAVDGARRVRPLSAWRRAGVAELRLSWQPRPASLAAV